MKFAHIICCLSLILFAAACSSPPEKPPYQGIKLGQSYQIYGRWYKPHYDAGYDEIGMASWYGPGFQGGKTASGERFNENDFTGAHRTLPLPCIVRVTNLDNGKSALIRINDRGPFARSRILDLSKGAAAKLGVIRTGTAKVRVQFLDQETRQYVQNASKGVEYAMNSIQHMPPAPEPQPVFISDAQASPTAPQIQAAPLAPVSMPQQPAPTPASSPSPDIFSVVDNSDSDSQVPTHEIAQYEPSVPIASGVSNGFFIQAGTFSQSENAQRLLDKLDAFDSAQVMEIMKGDKKFYRVMIGPYNTQSDAKNVLSKLAADGISGAKIIRN